MKMVGRMYRIQKDYHGDRGLPSFFFIVCYGKSPVLIYCRKDKSSNSARAICSMAMSLCNNLLEDKQQGQI